MLLTNRCKHTFVVLLAAQQPIQCNRSMHSMRRASQDYSFCFVECWRKHNTLT